MQGDGLSRDRRSPRDAAREGQLGRACLGVILSGVSHHCLTISWKEESAPVLQAKPASPTRATCWCDPEISGSTTFPCWLLSTSSPWGYSREQLPRWAGRGTTGGTCWQVPLQPCQLGHMAWTLHRVHWLLLSPPAASSKTREKNCSETCPSVPLLSPLPWCPRAVSGKDWAGVHYWCFCATTSACLLTLRPASCCPATPCQQGRDPVTPDSTFLQASRCLQDMRLRLPWAPHPLSHRARGKHTDCCKRKHFPSCPRFFPLLNFPTVLVGAVLGLALLNLECLHSVLWGLYLCAR